MTYTVKFPHHVDFALLVFGMKLKDDNYKSHWNILVFSEQWKMMSDLNMPHGKIWFCFIFSVWAHLSHNTQKFQIWKLLKY